MYSVLVKIKFCSLLSQWFEIICQNKNYDKTCFKQSKLLTFKTSLKQCFFIRTLIISQKKSVPLIKRHVKFVTLSSSKNLSYHMKQFFNINFLNKKILFKWGKFKYKYVLHGNENITFVIITCANCFEGAHILMINWTLLYEIQDKHKELQTERVENQFTHVNKRQNKTWQNSNNMC